jgi:(p)ppGpp synthase/HD superfamily hydrolase
MDSSALLDLAVAIASDAHQGQLDKYGKDYINHPMRVMNRGRNVDEKIVGILHDVVEDTPWTFEALEEKGFPINIMDALRCITKTSDDEDYDAYIDRCAADPLAVAVKIHDLTDNMDVRRMPFVGEDEARRLNKYLKAYRYLLPLYH